MALRSRLNVYVYTAPKSGFSSFSAREISHLITALRFTTVAPGGYGQLDATLNPRDIRISQKELAMFSQVAVMSGGRAVWLGEITDPVMAMDESLGEYLQLTALGLGNILRDDPGAMAYTNQTAQQIIVNQLARRNNGSPHNSMPTISNDTSLIFPDNPVATFSPVYDNRTFEEVLGDVAILAGDYQWGVWGHLTERDDAGYPKGQISVQQRDTTTTHYVASVAAGDITRYTLTPSSERAYNGIYVDYSTATGGVGTAVYRDARLGSDDSQQTAPFRWRKLIRDETGITTVNASQAQAIANAYGKLYQDPTYKVELTLVRVRAQRNPLDTASQTAAFEGTVGGDIPLWEVQADRNVFIPDFGVRGGFVMPTSPTPGINQFYIVNSEYREDASGQMQLVLQCDNFVDREATQIARLTLKADVQARSHKTTGTVQTQGAPSSGYVVIAESNGIGGNTAAATLQYVNGLYQSPTSIAFTTLTSANLGAPSAANITPVGAIAQATVSANGACKAAYTYTTSGNCLRAIRKRDFDWHCDGCGREFVGLSLTRDVQIQTAQGIAPGAVALGIVCPECASRGERPFTESFNTALRASDEEHGHQHRREQARLIRALMTHSVIGLEVLP